MENTATLFDVFISRKNSDAVLAKELYNYFTGQGLTVFESDETIPKMGSSDYRKSIDKALDECKHMVVVGSSLENISSSWVEAEWGLYIGEKRAGRKKGNILTVITDNLEIKDLPASLRNFEIIYFKKENFDRIAAYVGKDYKNPKFKPPRKSLLKSKWFLPTISCLCLISAFWYFMNEKNKPFDATIFLKPPSEIKLHPSYPRFKGGVLTVNLDNKEEKKTLLEDGEAVFKQIPVRFKDQKITVKLTSKNWKLILDTIKLNQTVNIVIIPDGSLATIYGNVKDQEGNEIKDCPIIIDNNDTTIFTDSNGFFKVNLPYQMQKDKYVLNIHKKPYKPVTEEYLPESGNIDIVLEK